MIKERPMGAQDPTLTGDDLITHDEEQEVEALEGRGSACEASSYQDGNG
jgi:hypothetical protein